VYIDQFRAEAFLKSVANDRGTTDGIKPSLATAVTRQRTTSSSSSPLSPVQPSSSSVHRRRSSVSVSVPDRRQQAAVSRSLSSTVPLATSPPPPSLPLPAHARHHVPDAATAVHIDVKSHDVPTPATVEAIFEVGNLVFMSAFGPVQRRYKTDKISEK